jgi:hypothetical protein
MQASIDLSFPEIKRIKMNEKVNRNFKKYQTAALASRENSPNPKENFIGVLN